VHIISRLTQGFSIRCLRFTNDVAAAHARLASGWRASPLPGGGRTLWIAMKGFRLHPSSFPGLSPVARVVYAKPPFGGPKQVLAYLGRYTHRVAIANSRLISLSDGKVSFSWKDYRQNSKTKVMTLNAEEFIRRFLLHSLPDGFHRIRHYGFFANGGRHDRLELCRQLLAARNAAADREVAADLTVKRDVPVCPDCGGLMRRVGIVPRGCERQQPFRCDTS